MKKIVLAIGLTVSSIMANNISVEITGMLNQNGKISIGLYNKNDNTFSNILKSYKGANVKIVGKKVTYTFKNIPDGTYAIAVIHDENRNKKLDKNFLGMPTEGYGFSNNIRPTFRAATFEESKFEVNKDKMLTIKMGY
ncbi:hypothetical protein MNB_ARC-1_233 [hydrothermal vent metagenome]|uniref:DUF2141 domain-containing protein n=1 Tax=hydrothermal vent metagenome TaxID=652676 RepID=A0A3B1E1E7_9ZZZZ